MNNTIIAIYGRTNEGKTRSICQAAQILNGYSQAQLHPANTDFSKDIHCWIQLGTRRIGCNSQGDPEDYNARRNELEQLVRQDCEIIICASRTRGNTVDVIQDVANDHDYHVIWISSFYSGSLDHTMLNSMAARNIVELVRSLITAEL